MAAEEARSSYDCGPLWFALLVKCGLAGLCDYDVGAMTMVEGEGESLDLRQQR